jgi:hypothetical protein
MALTLTRQRGPKLEQDLAEVQQAIAEAESAAAASDALAEVVRAERAGLVEQEAAGTLSRDKVDERALALHADEQRHSAVAARRREVAEIHRSKLAPLEADLAMATYEARLAAVNKLVERQNRAASAVSKALGEAVAAADAYAMARARTTEGLAEIKDLRDGLHDPDSADYPDSPGEIGLVGGGPLVADNSTIGEVCPPGTKFLILNWPGHAHLPRTLFLRDGLGRLFDALIT